MDHKKRSELYDRARDSLKHLPPNERVAARNLLAGLDTKLTRLLAELSRLNPPIK